MCCSSIHYQAGGISRSKAATAHSKHAFWVLILLIKYCVLQPTAGGKGVIEIPLTFQSWSALVLFPQRRRQIETEGERRWSSTKKTHCYVVISTDTPIRAQSYLASQPKQTKVSENTHTRVHTYKAKIHRQVRTMPDNATISKTRWNRWSLKNL